MGMGQKVDRLPCGLEQYTDWLYPSGLMETEWGIIRQDAWCELEAQRLRLGGRRARAVKHRDGRAVAIFGEPLTPPDHAQGQQKTVGTLTAGSVLSGNATSGVGGGFHSNGPG